MANRLDEPAFDLSGSSSRRLHVRFAPRRFFWRGKVSTGRWILAAETWLKDPTPQTYIHVDTGGGTGASQTTEGPSAYAGSIY